jgi:hypothetical protein
MDNELQGDEAIDMLRWIVQAYHPRWQYSMEVTGYQCDFCRSVFDSSREFQDTDGHKFGCQWAQSKVWLSEQPQETTP